LKHKVSESEERVQGGLLLPLLPTLNSVKPGGGDQDRVILALMIEVETEIPRGRELALPVTHGGAVEGEGVDVPDVGLGGPLLVQPELLLPPDVVEDWRPAGWANVIASPLPWTPPDLYCLWNTSLLCLANIFDKYPYLKNTSIQILYCGYIKALALE